MKLLSTILLLAAACAVVHAAKLPWATHPHARDGDFVPPKWWVGWVVCVLCCVVG